MHAHQPLPVFYWIIPAIQSALVVASALTGVTLTVQFRVVRRTESPRSYLLWLVLWAGSTLFEIAAGVAALL